MKKNAFALLLILHWAFFASAQNDRVLPNHLNAHIHRVVALPDSNLLYVGGSPKAKSSDDSAFVCVQNPLGQLVWLKKRRVNHASNYFDVSLLSDQTFVAAGIENFHGKSQMGTGSIPFYHPVVRRMDQNGNSLDQGTNDEYPYRLVRTGPQDTWWAFTLSTGYGLSPHLEIWEDGTDHAVVQTYGVNDYYPLEYQPPMLKFMKAGEYGLSRCNCQNASYNSYLCNVTTLVSANVFVRIRAYSPFTYVAMTDNGAFYEGDENNAQLLFAGIGANFIALDFDLDSTHLWVLGKTGQDFSVVKIDRNSGQQVIFPLSGAEQDFESIAVSALQVALSGAESRLRINAPYKLYNALPLLRTMTKEGVIDEQVFNAAIGHVDISGIQVTSGSIHLDEVQIKVNNEGTEEIHGFWLNRFEYNTSDYVLPEINPSWSKYYPVELSPGDSTIITLNGVVLNGETAITGENVCWMINAPSGHPDANHANDWSCTSLDSNTSNTEPDNPAGLTLLGNPAHDLLSVRLDDPALTGQPWSILDVTGLVRATGQFSADSVQKIELADLNEGLYFLKSGKRTWRFIRL